MTEQLNKRIKKLMLQDPIVLAAPLQTRFEKRPFSKTILSPKGLQPDPIQKVALALLLIPAMIAFLAGLLSANWTLAAITAFILILVGFMIWIIKLRAQMSWKVTWHEDAVELEDGRYGKTEFWVEPLSAFTGLKIDFGLIPRSSSYSLGRKVHGLFLAHPDPFKSVLLHAGLEPIEMEIVAYYEQALGKSLIK